MPTKAQAVSETKKSQSVHPVARFGTAAALLVGGYGIVMLVLGGNAYQMQIATLIAINSIMAVSLNLINGFTGLFSIGHAGFMAIGAYTSAVASVMGGMPFTVSLLVGGIAAMVVGLVVGLPTLRLGGDYLAIATLGFGEIIRVIIVNIDYVGGPRGLTGIPGHTSFAWAYGLAALTVFLIMNLVNSTHGRACKAIREDETAASAMGINVTFYKVAVFVVASFFAGVGGGLLVHTIQFAHPSMFNVMRSVDYLIMIVVGGYGSITGAIVAATVLTTMTEALRTFAEWRMLLYGLLLITVMLTRPKGLMGSVEFTMDGFFGFLRRSGARKTPTAGVKGGDA